MPPPPISSQAEPSRVSLKLSRARLNSHSSAATGNASEVCAWHRRRHHLTHVPPSPPLLPHENEANTGTDLPLHQKLSNKERRCYRKPLYQGPLHVSCLGGSPSIRLPHSGDCWLIPYCPLLTFSHTEPGMGKSSDCAIRRAPETAGTGYTVA